MLDKSRCRGLTSEHEDWAETKKFLSASFCSVRPHKTKYFQGAAIMAESVHRKLERVRPPRVHITYEVETGDAIQLKEIPFVMGVLGDFSGAPAEALPRLRDRKFVEVNPDNFDDVLKSMKPRLTYKVDNKMSTEAGKIGVELNFESFDDFSPERVAQQVEPLRKLLQLRQQLADLRGSLQGNDKLEEILQATVNDVDRLAKLKTELEAQGAADGQ
jgi:type VI secretion system protein ImpB